MWARVMVAVALLASEARADDACDADCRIAKVRELLEQGDKLAARAELIAIHDETQRPELLFALGQVELQLGNHAAAIDYYERFIATGPAEEQVALAQQAIGAARLRMVEPPPEPPRPPIVERPPPPVRRFERRWGLASTILVAVGGAALAGGGGLLVHAHRLGNDASGTLAEYDDRLEHAEFRRALGIAGVAAGAIAVGVAIVRWRLDRTEILVEPTAVSVVRRW